MVQVDDISCLPFLPKKEVKEGINATMKQWSNKKLDIAAGVEGKMRFPWWVCTIGWDDNVENSAILERALFPLYFVQDKQEVKWCGEQKTVEQSI